jgi:tetratricopeptide (TPR) repeat protein
METKMKQLLSLSLAAFLLTAGLTPVFAAGGDNDESTTTIPPAAVLKCKKGEVAKNVTKDGVKKQTCVKLKADILPDEDLYQQGRLIAKSGHYDWALDVLAQIKDQNDPRVLNYTGYSNRKAGRLEVGIAFYRKALAINPDFVLAREYLGEGYVAAGRIDLALVELGEIEKRTGRSTDEYKKLSNAIALGENN